MAPPVGLELAPKHTVLGKNQEFVSSLLEIKEDPQKGSSVSSVTQSDRYHQADDKHNPSHVSIPWDLRNSATWTS